MLAYTPVALKLSDQPIYAIRALAYGPRQFLIAAAGQKLWVYLVTHLDPPRHRTRGHRSRSHSRASNLSTHLLVEWTPMDPPPTAETTDTCQVFSDPCSRRSDASGCPFHSGFMTPDPISPPADADGHRRRRHPPSRNESLYTLSLLTLPPEYTGPLGSPGHVVCLTGGRAGYLHVFNVHTQSHVRVIRAGIGGDVNDIQTYPGRAEWVVVACKDRTVRMIDLHRGVSMVVFGGVDGHQGQVLCASVHPTGKWIVSGGADCAVRVWRVPDAMGKGEEVRVDRCAWWTQWPHANYVDGVAFVGDEDERAGMAVVSKSVDGEAVVWRVEMWPTQVPASGQTLEAAGGKGDGPAWATHSELNADVEERGPRPLILAILTYPPHNLWFFKLSLSLPYLALGTGSGAMAVWNLARTLRVLRDRTRAAAQCAATLDPDDHDKVEVPARVLAGVVTPTADFSDRYSNPGGDRAGGGAGPVVWTRKAMGKDVAGELVRMCVAVPFEMDDDAEEEEGARHVDGDLELSKVRFADVSGSESDEDDDGGVDEGRGVLLLLAGVTESGKLVISVARDRAPVVGETSEDEDEMSER